MMFRRCVASLRDGPCEPEAARDLDRLLGMKGSKGCSGGDPSSLVVRSHPGSPRPQAYGESMALLQAHRRLARLHALRSRAFRGGQPHSPALWVSTLAGAAADGYSGHAEGDQ